MSDTPVSGALVSGSAYAHDEPVTQPELAALPPVSWESRYVLGAMLGEGGMSVVHEAFDLLLMRTVAIKVLKGPSLPSIGALTQEARALAAVEHPGVVRVHGVYPAASPPFIVMERARGLPLTSLVRQGRLPMSRALPILRQIALGVDALHEAGIVHGDVKPANVIVDTGDQTKLIDVGLAPLLSRMRPGEIVGTPSYMAPERALGVETPSTELQSGDVYSFGALCFELLTGQLPFPKATGFSALMAHIHQVPPLASQCSELSPQFDRPLSAALAKRPDQRPRSCAELVDALESASHGCDAYGRRSRVVVADDDPDHHALLTAVLGVHLPGAEIVLCGTGESALEALARGHTSVAVLDLAMPGVSGLDLVRQVREESPGTAIVIVTGGGSGIERRAARDLGVRRFLVKPCEVDELVLAIQSELGRDAAQRSA